MRLSYPPALTLILAVAAASVLPAQDRAAAHAGGVTPTTVPLDTESGYVVLPVAINGSDPLPVLLDTGMPSPGIVLFDGPHVAELDLEYLPQRAVIGGAGGSSRHEARICAGATLEIGDAKLENARVVALPPIPYFHIGLAGIVGAEALSAFAISVDYDAKQIVLTDPAAFKAPEGSTCVPLEMIGGIPHIEAAVTRGEDSDRTLQLLLDTGAHHALSLDAQHRDLASHHSTDRRQIGRGLSGPLFGTEGRIPELHVAGHELTSIVTSFHATEDRVPRSGTHDGNAGIGLLSRFNFTLNYAENALYLTPARQFDTAFEADMVGLVLESETGERLKVAWVLEGSPAAAAGITPGDTVVAVDGVPVTGPDRLRLARRFRTAGALTLTVQAGDEEPKTFELELRRLL